MRLLLAAIALLLTLSSITVPALAESKPKKYSLISHNKTGKQDKKVEAVYPDYNSCLEARKRFLQQNGATGRTAYCD